MLVHGVLHFPHMGAYYFFAPRMVEKKCAAADNCIIDIIYFYVRAIYDIWTVRTGPLWRRHLGGIMSAIGINPSTADDCRRYRWLITARNINKHLSNPPPALLAVKKQPKISFSRAHARVGPLCKVHLCYIQERETHAYSSTTAYAFFGV